MASCPWWGEEIQPVVATRDYSSDPRLSFRRSVVSNSLRPHGLQHASLPCPSPSPGVCSNSCSSSQWCRPTIAYSAVPVSSRLRSFPASEPFPVTCGVPVFPRGGDWNLEFDEKSHPMGHSSQGLWFNTVDTLACYLPAGYIMEHVDRECAYHFSKQRALWSSSRQPLQSPWLSALRGLRMGKNRILALHSSAAYHTKGVIPMSPNSCIRPYMEKHYNC